MLCSNCESSMHTWCCARCGTKKQHQKYALHESIFCSAKCEQEQLREDRISNDQERR